MKKKVFAVIATVTTLFATVIASSACFFFSYQPKEPKCLRDE